MFRVVQKLAKPSLIKTTKLHQVGHTSYHQSIFPSLSTVRFYASEGVASSSNGLNLPVAIEMINYGFGLAREKKSSESYAQGLFVMEQCLSATSTESENTKGVILLAMSKLLSESGDFNEAMEKLQKILDLRNSSLGVRVAAIEGLVGLKLELGEDITSSELADKCVGLLKTGSEDSQTSSGDYEVLQTRVNGIKGLVELVNGSVENAGTCFQEDKSLLGNVMLSHGELLHATGNLASAKGFYQKAIQEIPEADSFGDLHSLATCNMVPVEVLLGATCALGQLEAHSGNFSDAEEILTRALTKAEEHFGPHHPKVGIILTCIALMFRHKAKLEHSSALLIQEGLYRRAIEMLKAPSLETQGEDSTVQRSDIVALARGGYADILSVQENRKAEGDRMRKWAESAWRNRRLSLAEALEISEPCTKVAVIDTRICRAL